MRSTLLFLAGIAFWIIQACEFPLDEENNATIQEPPDTATFDLSIIPGGDTILIIGLTTLTYNINTHNRMLYTGSINLIDRTWTINQTSGSITINPALWSNGYYPMTLVFYTSSGTGSLADHLGAEGYMGQIEWIVHINVTDPADTIENIKKPQPFASLTDDRYLKIKWSKCSHPHFKSYRIEVHSYGGYSAKEIFDPDSCFYINEDFVGGDLDFRVGITVTTYTGVYLWSDYLNLHENYPTIEFEEYGFDSVRVFWGASKYNCLFSLMDSYWYTYYQVSDTGRSVTIEHPGLMPQIQFDLFIEPNNADPDNSYTRMDYAHFGNLPDAPGSNLKYAYNVSNDILYASSYDDIECFDGDELSFINSSSIDHLQYQADVSCPLNSPQVAIHSADGIHIYPDESLTDAQFIPNNAWGWTVEHFTFADNGLITSTLNNKLYIFNTLSSELQVDSSLNHYPSVNVRKCLTTSQDGNFFVSASQTGLSLYRIYSDHVEEVFTDNRSYRSACFDPLHPDQLALTIFGEEDIEIRTCPDFSLVRDLPFSPVIVCNFDPETGNLLVTDLDHLYILNPENGETIFSIGCKGTFPVLLGNHLFSRGVTLNISSYIRR